MSRIERACEQAISDAEDIFRRLERQVPPPVLVERSSGWTWRYIEEKPEQAILLKCARAISGVRAVWLLLSGGFVQEAGTLMRSIDEIVDDIVFLSLGMRPGKWTQKHDSYVSYFWDEADDDDRGPTVQRKTIRAYNHRAFEDGDIDPSTADSIGRQLYSMFSRFVHARGGVLMEMIDSDPPLIALGGQGDDARRPFYRNAPHAAHNALMSVGYAANVIADADTCAAAFQAIKCFEREFGDLVFPPDRAGQY